MYYTGKLSLYSIDIVTNVLYRQTVNVFWRQPDLENVGPNVGSDHGPQSTWHNALSLLPLVSFHG